VVASFRIGPTILTCMLPLLPDSSAGAEAGAAVVAVRAVAPLTILTPSPPQGQGAGAEAGAAVVAVRAVAGRDAALMQRPDPFTPILPPQGQGAGAEAGAAAVAVRAVAPLTIPTPSPPQGQGAGAEAGAAAVAVHAVAPLTIPPPSPPQGQGAGAEAGAAAVAVRAVAGQRCCAGALRHAAAALLPGAGAREGRPVLLRVQHQVSNGDVQFAGHQPYT